VTQSKAAVPQARFSAARVAGAYLVVGLLWVGLSDFALQEAGDLTAEGLLLAVGKGATFIALSAGLIYYLVRRELRTVAKATAPLRAVIDGTSDAVFVKDLDGRYLLFNEAASAFVGKPIEEVLGRDDKALFDKAGAAQIMAADKEVISSGATITNEETATSAGKTRTYQATKAPYRDENGVVIGVIGISRDISERTQVEATLRESEARFRELADAIPQIVWTANPDGSLTHINALATTYSGLPQEALVGWALDEIVHPEDLPTLEASRAASTSTGIPRDVEFRLRRADGAYRWHVSRQVPSRAADGTVTHWYGTCTDIDDLKQVEHALRQTDERLREAQRIAHIGSWSWEPPIDRVWWSDAEYDLFAVDRSTSPSFGAFLELVHPEDRPIAIARVEAMRAGANEFADDLRLLRPDGSVVWIYSLGRATRDAEGKLLRVEGTDQDITARVLAARELRAERDRFESLAETLPVAICSFQLSAQGKLTMPYANPRIEPLYGLSPSELAQDAAQVFKFIHADDVARVRDNVIASAQKHSAWRQEFRVNSPRLGEIWLEGAASPTKAPDGSILWHGYVNDITARKQADALLRASEERLRLALEAAGAIAFVWDVPSDAVTRYFSKEPALPVTAEHVGTLTEVRQRIHPDDLAGFDRRLKACLDEGSDYHNAYRVVRPDGTTAFLDEHGFLERAADGSPLRLTAMSIDVSERIAAGEALLASEERYRQLVAVMPTAILVHDGERILFCNAAFVQLIGASSEVEVLKQRPLDWVVPDDRTLARARLLEHHASAESVSGTLLRFTRVDGRPVPTYAVSAPVTGYGPKASLLVLSDLTERERSTALLRSVLGSVDDAIVTIDARGAITSVNGATEHLFGFTEAELLGANVSMLMPEPHGDNHDGYIANYLHTGIARVIGTGREVEARSKDGSTFPAEVTVTEFFSDGERNFTGVIRDITARRRLEAQFRQAQKMEAVGRLAGGVAHDFNNLLTVINVYAEVLLQGLPPGDPAREPLAAVHDAGERAARLTEQLLAFSRKSVVAPRRIDLNELVTESSKLLRRLLGEDVALAVLTDAASAHVLIDPGQLEQVLMNLAVNARDAMPTGGRLTIESRTIAREDRAKRSHPELPAGRYIALRVSDTGCGMNDEVRQKIFEPFFTTKPIGQGTGLGLAVVHGVVAEAGGSIEVESSVGRGTTFTILLPEATAPAGTADASITPVAPRGHETVLLVEDEAAVRSLVQFTLEGLGYTVLPSSTGEQALALLKTHRVDLLISDVVMPQMSGDELMKAARAINPALRVLFMSGYTADVLDRHDLQRSGTPFIQKPFTALGLARRVRASLET
jgi:PAS domain S-box-containing protein